ncbi:MAG: metal ABC transporter ATP-binding protein [Elusimicrobiales bacterium]
MQIASAENLTVSYGGENALENVSFAINEGDFTAVMGPNGSGKTTLMRALLGLEKPSAGAAFLFGVPAEKFSDWAAVGYLPQARGAVYGNFPLTVREVVAMGLIARRKFPRFASKTDNAAVEAALESVRLADSADKLIGEVSGGQQQRAFLARALVNSPRLLLLDEPGAALDPKSRRGFYELLSRLNSGGKTTIILVTHDMAEAGRYAARLMMVDSRLVFHGTREEFCRSETVSEFFGPFSQHVICHRHDH